MTARSGDVSSTRQHSIMAHAATEEEVACQFYANMQLLHISLIATFSNISAKCTYVIFFPHKLAFSTAILILFVFLLPISIRPRFRYLDHLVANRMAPSVGPDPCGTRLLHGDS